MDRAAQQYFLSTISRGVKISPKPSITSVVSPGRTGGSTGLKSVKLSTPSSSPTVPTTTELLETIENLKVELAQKAKVLLEMSNELKLAKSASNVELSRASKGTGDFILRVKRLEEELQSTRIALETAQSSDREREALSKENEARLLQDREALCEVLAKEKNTWESLVAQLEDAVKNERDAKNAAASRIDDLLKDAEKSKQAREECARTLSSEQSKLRGEINSLSSSLAKVGEERAQARAGKVAAEAALERGLANLTIAAGEVELLKGKVRELEETIHRLEVEKERALSQATLASSQAEGALKLALSEASGARAVAAAVEEATKKSLEVSLAASQTSLSSALAENESLKNRYEREKIESRTHNSSAMDDLKHAHATLIDELRATHSAAQNTLSLSHECELQQRHNAFEEFRKTHSLITDALKMDAEAARSECAKIREVYEGEVSRLKAEALVEENCSRGAISAAQASATWANRELDRLSLEAKESVQRCSDLRNLLAVEAERTRLAELLCETQKNEIVRLRKEAQIHDEELSVAKSTQADLAREHAKQDQIIKDLRIAEELRKCAERDEEVLKTELSEALQRAESFAEKCAKQEAEITRLTREVDGLIGDRVALAGAEASVLRISEALVHAEASIHSLEEDLVKEKGVSSALSDRLTRLYGELGNLAAASAASMRDAQELRNALDEETLRRGDAAESYEEAMRRSEELAAKLSSFAAEETLLSKRIEELSFAKDLAEETCREFKERTEEAERECARARLAEAESSAVGSGLQRMLQASQEKIAHLDLQIAHLTSALGRGVLHGRKSPFFPLRTPTPSDSSRGAISPKDEMCSRVVVPAPSQTECSCSNPLMSLKRFRHFLPNVPHNLTKPCSTFLDFP